MAYNNDYSNSKKLKELTKIQQLLELDKKQLTAEINRLNNENSSLQETINSMQIIPDLSESTIIGSDSTGFMLSYFELDDYGSISSYMSVFRITNNVLPCELNIPGYIELNPDSNTTRYDRTFNASDSSKNKIYFKFKVMKNILVNGNISVFFPYSTQLGKNKLVKIKSTYNDLDIEIRNCKTNEVIYSNPIDKSNIILNTPGLNNLNINNLELHTGDEFFLHLNVPSKYDTGYYDSGEKYYGGIRFSSGTYFDLMTNTIFYIKEL